MILDVARVGSMASNGGSDLRAYLLACYPEAPIPPLSHVVATAEPMIARVNHGRWIASCSCGAKGIPTPGCLVNLDVPLGWCVRCGNQAWGGGWRPVIVPPAVARAQIEAVLLCRPHIEHRNWEPGETVADLIRENLEHDDPVPTLIACESQQLGPSWREMVAPFNPLPKMPGRLRRAASWLMRGR